VHPDALDAEIDALLDDLIGNFGLARIKTASGFSGIDFRSG